jgi:hypothetical protein
LEAWRTASFSHDAARDQGDGFRQALEMLDNGRLPDSSVDAEHAALLLAQRYAYVFPSDSALAMLAALGPLVEVGAGTGYWAHRMRSIGVDIVAFDQAPVDGERANRYHSDARPWTQVERGDQTVLSGHADRGLFLCWPPLFSSLGDCLTYYRGDTVACIGDGGHRTSSLDHLHGAFTKVAAAPVRALDPHPGARPQLTIWKRRPGERSRRTGRSLPAPDGSPHQQDLDLTRPGLHTTPWWQQGHAARHTCTARVISSTRTTSAKRMAAPTPRQPVKRPLLPEPAVGR